ncbi:N-acetylmuramoyl-L-alanine amidase [Pedobacter sp. UYEF25]
MRQINYIVLHCTDGPPNQSTAEILHYWKTVNGWKSPGYHFEINADGSFEQLLPIEQVANGVKGHNQNSVHISYKGGQKGIDTRTCGQIQTQIKLINDMRVKFPNAKILGHRDFAGVTKSCPSFDVATWLKKVGIKQL